MAKYDNIDQYLDGIIHSIAIGNYDGNNRYIKCQPVVERISFSRVPSALLITDNARVNTIALEPTQQ